MNRETAIITETGPGKMRPEVLEGRTIKVPSPYGTVFVTVNENGDGSPFEIFLNVGKCGSDVAADAEAIGRLCSLFLRLPSCIPELEKVEMIIRHLAGIGGSREIENGSQKIRSVPDAVALALRLYIQSPRSHEQPCKS